MRVALFGGSFDPPHRGHLAVATTAAERLRLDQVLVAPVGHQPLKEGLALAGYEDRLAMVELAFAGDPRCAASRIDAPTRSGTPNFTYDTLRALRRQIAASDRLFFLIGADSFHTLAHWYRAGELLLLCDFIVATRPGYPLREIGARLPAGVRVADERLAGELPEVRVESETEGGPSSTLFLLTDLAEDVSATGLRHALAAGDTARSAEMLAPGVLQYIREHELYL
jgi:nicotinate-nucleotide adenylyltransferase